MKTILQWETGPINIDRWIEIPITSERIIINLEIIITWEITLHIQKKIMTSMMNQLAKVEGLIKHTNRIKVNKEIKDSNRIEVKINSMKESIVKDKHTIKFLNKMPLTWIKKLLNLVYREPKQTTIISKIAHTPVILPIIVIEKIQETL